MCNTRLRARIFFIIFIFRARCDQLPSANKHILLDRRNRKLLCSLQPHSFRTPACRRSDPALNQYSRNCFGKKKTENWLSIDLCELFRTSFHPGLCIDTRFVVLVLFVHAVMYLPFSPFYEFRFASECHSVFIRSSALVA